MLSIPVVDATPQSNDSLLLPEERRVVTIMFADITGSTPLAAIMDPEDMRAILTGYFTLMTEQIRKHDGTVEKYIGDAVMAVFGTPLTHEDDPDRAIRAALDMQIALQHFNNQRLGRDSTATRLQMRIGINTGEVAAMTNEGQLRQDFLITGDAVNIAARLQQVATPDTILVGERTYLATRDVFDFTTIAPLHLKGKSTAINAYVVQGLHQSGSVITQHPRGLGQPTALVGRTIELMLLHTNFARVQAERRPHFITILGAPGVGKSRLVREFIAREQELAKSAASQASIPSPLVLKGRCPPYGEGITYWPLIEIIRSLLNVQNNDTQDDLQERFISFMHDLFAKAHISESPEEIAETLLRRIGKNLNGRDTQDDALNQSDYSKTKFHTTLHTSNLKQAGTQSALLRAWRILFEALGEIQPLIIVVDDIQWADEALLDLLEYLADRITAVPILFLCPARPDFLEQRRAWGGGHRNFTAIELESLSWEESSNLIDELLNTNDLPENLRYIILSRAEGNPFFVEEIVRMLIDQSILVHGKKQENGQDYWSVNLPGSAFLNDLSQQNDQTEDDLLTNNLLQLPHVPDTVQGVLAARIDLLELPEKLVLQHAAIIGRTFWLSALLELTNNLTIDQILLALTSLTKRGFIVEIERKRTATTIDSNDQVFSFKHVLTRDVVHNNIPRQRRAYEHAHIALWIEEKIQDQQDSFSELLAYHYQQALIAWSTSSVIDVIQIKLPSSPQRIPIRLTRALLREKTVRALVQTGDHALQSYYALRALRAFTDAEDILQESGKTVEQTRTLATIEEKIGDAYTQRGEQDDAWQHYQKALRTAEASQDTPEEGQLLKLYDKLSLLATRWLLRFNTPPEIQEVRNYIDAGLRILAGLEMSSMHVAFLTYQAFWYIRQLETAPNKQKADLAKQALESGKQALTSAETLNNPRMLSLALDAMGFIYLQYHQYHKSLELQSRRLQIENFFRTDREEIYDLYLSLGAAYEQVADYQSALSCYGRARSSAMAMESPGMVLNSMVGRMNTWRLWNRWDNAEQVAQETLEFIEHNHQDELRQRWALETLAVIAYHRGNREDGAQYARQYRRLLEQQIQHTHPDETSQIDISFRAIYHAQEDWQHAAEGYRNKLKATEPFPSPQVLSTLAELLITIKAPLEEQEATCERAVNEGERAGARKSLSVALRARGRMYLAQQKWEQAERDLRQSLELSEMLNLPWEQAHTLYFLGQLYKQHAGIVTDSQERNSDREKGHYYLEQAHGYYASLKAMPAMIRVQRELTEKTSV
ncbi:MAG TPA: adenylate/guanylate cyclase domain-containing protein [Dictyobacter sp.]|jgi:predicted ATPase/class 3 adenylate cyclase|nr:adenylate/guanylate cyclase domain-containing protein [Dictyobacter sp.]